MKSGICDQSFWAHTPPLAACGFPRDKGREQHQRDQGLRILRVWNSGVSENIEGVMDAIVGALGPPPPSPPRKGEGSLARLRRGAPQ